MVDSSSTIEILVLSAGRRVELCRLLRMDAAQLGVRARLIAADVAPHLSAACAVADEAHALPPALDDAYADAVVSLARRCGARVVIPTIDPELPGIARARPALEDSDAVVNIAEIPVVETARDKIRTERTLRAAGVKTPRTALPREVLDEVNEWQWPIIVKPVNGSASSRVRKAHTPDELERLSVSEDDLIVQELLGGHEVTVNVFVDRSGSCRSAVSHLRREVRSGEVSKGITFRTHALRDTAHAVVAALPGAFGAMCFQAILTPEGPVVFEVNARFGGGFPLAHRAGAPFTKWLMEIALGRTPTCHDEWLEGIYMLRFDEATYGLEESPDLRSRWFV